MEFIVVDNDRDDVIETVARELRRPVYFDSSFDDRIMNEIGRNNAPVSLVARLTRPRSLRVSPLTGLALAAAVSLLIIGIPTFGDITGSGEPGALGDVVSTRFVLVAPEAASVAVVGDFNDWNSESNKLERFSPSGVWTATMNLAPGRYKYTFVIDGKEWVADPLAPKATNDDFGTPSSVILVPERSS